MKERSGPGYAAFKAAIFIILTVVSLAAIVPLALAIIVSISDEHSIMFKGYSFLPEKLSTLAYSIIFRENWVFNAYKITLATTAIGTSLCVLFSAMIGYAIHRPDVKYRNVVAMILFIPMIFSAGLIPWYLWVTKYLHMKNSIWALIFPTLINPFWIFLLRNYFKSVPPSLAESAEMDGAGPFYTLFRIILPLSTPIVATIVLFAALEYWNNYTTAIWLLEKMELYPLQYMLYRVQALVAYKALARTSTGAVKPTESVQMATFIIALGPIVLVYPFIQKYFVKGIMIGAVKG
jgi:ABC-type glycerol-3-phosphate transport system permease component